MLTVNARFLRVLWIWWGRDFIYSCPPFHLLLLSSSSSSLYLHISLPFIFVLSCCSRVYSMCECGRRDYAGLHARASRCCVHVWPLALSFDWAAYQTGCALGAEFVSRQTLSVGGGEGSGGDGGGGRGIASNFLTQKLPPGRFPLSLLPHPQHSYSTHTLPIPLTSAGEANKQSVQWQHKVTRTEPLKAASPHWLIVWQR